VINFILSPLISDVIKKTTQAHTMNGSPVGEREGVGTMMMRMAAMGGRGERGGRPYPSKKKFL
jgi:hypothetical protein